MGLRGLSAASVGCGLDVVPQVAALLNWLLRWAHESVAGQNTTQSLHRADVAAHKAGRVED